MTENEFLLYWKLLCERHRIEPSAPLTRVYALTLRGEGLSAAEWATAVAASIRFDQFMPSVQQLIDHARPSFKARALEEWDACLERARQNQPATLPGSATRTLMNQVTNGVPLGQVDQERLPWIKKEFLERYVGHLTTEARHTTPALVAAARELPHAG